MRPSYRIFLLRSLFFFFPWFGLSAEEKVYFATSADTEHYEWALNLIATIHRFHFDELGEIAVFDLGLTEEEKSQFIRLEKVTIHAVEPVNTDIFTKFKVRSNGKIARGWYSWKPVVLKQALELFSEVLYLDAGITLVGPLTFVFQQLKEEGCFLIDCGHSIRRMTIRPVIEKFGLDDPEKVWVLDEMGLSAGFQGLTRSLAESYIQPLYKMAFDIFYFVDDGSVPKGFDWSRHDQPLFSIQARLLGLNIHERMRDQEIILFSDGRQQTIKLDRFVKFSREQFDLNKTREFLRYKNTH